MDKNESKRIKTTTENLGCDNNLKVPSHVLNKKKVQTLKKTNLHSLNVFEGEKWQRTVYFLKKGSNYDSKDLTFVLGHQKRQNWDKN